MKASLLQGFESLKVRFKIRPCYISSVLEEYNMRDGSLGCHFGGVRVIICKMLLVARGVDMCVCRQYGLDFDFGLKFRSIECAPNKLS